MNVTNMSFAEIMDRTRGHIVQPNKLLAFDPGETCGVAIMDGLAPRKLEQLPLIKSPNIGKRLEQLFDEVQPDFVVLENYRVYASHAKQHINSELFTAQLIGRIKQVCETRDIPHAVMLAAQTKAFVTDERLIQWGMIRSTSHDFRHAQDALRVALSFLLFGG